MAKAKRDGYWFTLDGLAYFTRKDNGQPYTFPFLWEFIEGIPGVVIFDPDDRYVLRNAGDLWARREHVEKARRLNRAARFHQTLCRALDDPTPGAMWAAYLAQCEREGARAVEADKRRKARLRLV